MLVCVTNYLILSFGAGEAFLDDNKFILFYFFLKIQGRQKLLDDPGKYIERYNIQRDLTLKEIVKFEKLASFN